MSGPGFPESLPMRHRRCRDYFSLLVIVIKVDPQRRFVHDHVSDFSGSTESLNHRLATAFANRSGIGYPSASSLYSSWAPRRTAGITTSLSRTVYIAR